MGLKDLLSGVKLDFGKIDEVFKAEAHAETDARIRLRELEELANLRMPPDYVAGFIQGYIEAELKGTK